MELKILLLGDSRMLPREWEGKQSYLEQKLMALIQKRYLGKTISIKTIAEPNKLMRTLGKDYNEIINYFPDILILNLNLCEYIPRLLPLSLFTYLDSLAAKHPHFVSKVRSFLKNNRRVLHLIIGKNAWNNKKGFIRDLRATLGTLSGVTDNILYLGCINTSESSEHIRPGFTADIFGFNEISAKIVQQEGFHYLDLNGALTSGKYPYEEISHEGIHYTDKGDDVIAEYIFDNWLEKQIDNVFLKGISANVPRRPDYIQVELTNHCSAKCTMCELNASTRPKGYVKEDILLKILDQLVEWGVPMVRFTLWGEALLHPDIINFIKIAKGKGLKVGLNTNGITVNNTLSRQLINAGLDEIIFSVDSYDDENIYKLFRPNSKSIRDINNNILGLLNARNELHARSPQVRIQMIGTNLNITQHKKFLEYWTPLVDSCRITHLYSMEVIPDYDRKLMKESDYFHECRYPWTTMGIYYNGDVTACCRDVDGELKVGNILEEKLSSLYLSNFMYTLRKNLLMKNKRDMPSFCQHCFKYDLIKR